MFSDLNRFNADDDRKRITPLINDGTNKMATKRVACVCLLYRKLFRKQKTATD